MKEIKAVIQPFMLEKVLDALAVLEGLPGLTVSHVQGWGRSRSGDAGGAAGHGLAAECKIEIIVHDSDASRVVDAIVAAARTGRPSDGKVFVLDVLDVVRIHTGERGAGAI
jgi:nitrogen regulatory protein P-II 1